MATPEFERRDYKDVRPFMQQTLAETSKELVAASSDYKVRTSNRALLTALALALGFIAIIAATWGSQTIFATHPYISAIAPLYIAQEALSGALIALQSTSPPTPLG
jgi:hypothetical protein